MLKETMTYIDFDGNERTEDFYFNLTEAEVMEFELGTTGGLTKLIEKIVAEKDNKKIIEIFKEIILKAYGVKSLDGKQFIKNEQVRNEFAQTQAYSDLFMKLATDSEAATKFINGIVPPNRPGDHEHKKNNRNSITPNDTNKVPYDPNNK